MHIPLLRLALGDHLPVSALRPFRRAFFDRGSFDGKSYVLPPPFACCTISLQKHGTRHQQAVLESGFSGTQAAVERGFFNFFVSNILSKPGKNTTLNPIPIV
jgi:hypothetical protein